MPPALVPAMTSILAVLCMSRNRPEYTESEGVPGAVEGDVT